ncbi:MAG: undecaprenyl-diphosphate phosphatase, partial [Pseudomonadota bacterium]
MSLEQILVLAIVQGLTEFLPVSSSGHLILIPAFTGWPDQGIVTDVMVHVGSLFAVIVYFWRDVLSLAGGCGDVVRGRVTARSRMATYIALATIPALAFGALLKFSGVSASIRGVEVVAFGAIFFGIVMYVADVFGKRVKKMEDMTLSPALIIGLAQAVALIPGTSRSGITMTAARFLGFERGEAARFSFLLGIPAITAAGLFTALEAVQEGGGIPP